VRVVRVPRAHDVVVLGPLLHPQQRIALAAPIMVPAFAAGMRPLAKAVIKGGIMVYDKGAEVLAEAGEQLSDLVAEVRSELNATATAASEAAASAATNGSLLDD